MTLNDSTERRDLPRRRPNSLVYVDLPPANGGMVRDLSQVGFAVRAILPLRPTEKVPFSMSLGDHTIDGDAIVLWAEEGGRLAGLEFAGLAAHARDKISNWLASFEVASAAASSEAADSASTFDQLRDELRDAKPRPAGKFNKGVGLVPPARVRAPKPAERVPVLVDALPVEEPASPKGTELAPQPVAVLTPAPHAPLESSSDILVSAFLQAPRLAAEQTHTLPESEAAPQKMPPALEPLSFLEEESDDKASPGWMDRFTLGRAIGIMLVIMLAAGFFAYRREVGRLLIWMGQQMSGGESSRSAPAPAAAPLPSQPAPGQGESTTPPKETQTAAEPATTPAPVPKTDEAASAASRPSSGSATAAAALPNAPAESPAPQTKPSSAGSLVPLRQTERETPAPPPPAGAIDGAAELQQAEQILRDPNREVDTPRAIRLLWNSIEKGNLTAEIALADLYRTGRGVARNCDQARILLGSAARKGSTEAQKRLTALQNEGCQE